MRQWQGKEDQRPSNPTLERIGQHRLAIYTVPGGIPYEMPKFSLMLPTRDTTGDFEEMCLLAGAESSPLVKSVRKADDIVVDMAEGARAIPNRRREAASRRRSEPNRGAGAESRDYAPW